MNLIQYVSAFKWAIFWPSLTSYFIYKDFSRTQRFKARKRALNEGTATLPIYGRVKKGDTIEQIQ